MVIQLPKAIDEYFEADKGRNADAVAECFTEFAIVKDEGKTHIGREAIRKWKAGSSTQYSYTVEPFSVVTEADRTIVTSHVVGNFPGSPVDLRYFFVPNGAKIAELEIIP